MKPPRPQINPRRVIVQCDSGSVRSFIRATLLLAVMACATATGAAGLPVFTPLPLLLTNLVSPARIATDAQSRLYVTDPAAGKVVVFDAAGRRLAEQGKLGQPLGIAVAEDGKIYLGDGRTGSVRVFDQQWNLLGHLGQGQGEFSLPGYIAALTDAGTTTVYVSDGLAHSIKVYRDGVLINRFGSRGVGPNQFDFPAGIWISPERQVFVVDQNGDRVQVLDLEGRFLRWFTLLPDPSQAVRSGRAQGITGDGQGRLLITDTFQGFVKAFDLSGAFLGFIGGHGEKSGQLRSPAGVVLDALGRLWVADANNSRVQAFGADCHLQLAISPASQTVATGAVLNLAAGVGCPGIFDFQWSKDGVPLLHETNSALTLINVTSNHTGGYVVTVSNANTVITSPAITVTVVSGPTIVSHPIGRTVAQAGNVTFTVGASGVALAYQWLRNGTELAGATQSALQITNAQPYEAGNYVARVSNAAGSINSAVAALTVLVAPVITEPLTDRMVTQGGSMTFSIAAIGTAPLAYQWLRNGSVLTGQTKTQLTISNATATANGVYQVRVSNTAGIATSAARFAVNAPVTLSSTRGAGGSLILSWNDPFYVVQAAPSLSGPWEVVADGSPFTVPLNLAVANDAQFFRLSRR